MTKNKTKTAPKSAREVQLEQTVTEMSLQMAAAGRSVGQQGMPVAFAGGAPVVGVRNISSDTIGLPASPMPGEAAVTLHADFGEPDPHVTAIVSLAWWMQLRRSPLYGNGMIARDDAILGTHNVPAPDDRPQDCAPNHEVNAVRDPVAWIEESTEVELRDKVSRITSESTLRRLQAAIDARVGTEQAKYPLEDDKRAAKAVKDMPAIYSKLESLVEDRMSVIRPGADF